MTQTSELSIRVFGPQAQLVSGQTLTIPEVTLPITVEDLFVRIGETYPALRNSLPQSRLAVDHEFVTKGDSISEFEEIALIGLISGG